MKQLDDRKNFAKLDSNDGLSSIEQLPQQCEQAWTETQLLEIPEIYKQSQNVVVCGMGASWIGAHIIQGLLEDQLTLPLIVNHDYRVPQFVSEKSLVIASSYSGSTEETISALTDAYEKGAKIITISKGGDLAAFAKKHKLPHYSFEPKYNPANSPRLGLGYSVVAQLAILTQLKIIDISHDEIITAIRHLKVRVAELMPESNPNEAKATAEAFQGYIPILVAGTFLLGNAHLFSNQFNETAKSFATYFHIPELNHHLMEGLGHPQEAKKLKFLFLESNLYDDQVKKRFMITKEVIEKNNITHHSYAAQGTSKIVQAFDTMLFGSFVTYYLAMLHDEEPTPNPWVDYFKNRLKEV